jgi:hypothetical protein
LERAQWPLYGNYLGSDDTNPTEKYRIKIFRGIKNGFYTADSLTNLPNNCTKLPLSIANRTAFEFVINRTEVILDGKLYPTPNCYFFEEDKHIGYLKLDRRTIVIEYEFTDKTLAQASLQKRTFTGIKQN